MKRGQSLCPYSDGNGTKSQTMMIPSRFTSPGRMQYDNTSPCSVAYMTTSGFYKFIFQMQKKKMVTQNPNEGMEG